MKRICAWCKDEMGEKPGDSEETHGICPTCVAVHFPGYEAACTGHFKHDVAESAEKHGETLPSDIMDGIRA